jgi:hypothetical protein
MVRYPYQDLDKLGQDLVELARYYRAAKSARLLHSPRRITSTLTCRVKGAVSSRAAIEGAILLPS